MKKRIRPTDIFEELDKAHQYAQIAKLTWQGTKPLYSTREEWLNALMVELNVLFRKHGYELNGNIRLSCGFPRGRKVIVGQCWSYSQSRDKTTEIFISPNIDDPIQAGDILAHELCHASVGVAAGHGPHFQICAIKIGLIGPMLSTIAGPDLVRYLADCFDSLGKYPHAKLLDVNSKKQTTRLIKCQCRECGYNCRITRQWLDNDGPPICPHCHLTLIANR